MVSTLCAKAEEPAFPLHVAANGRHLEDAAGRPFLITGDAAWSLIGELTREEAEEYLEDRRSRGFNTLLVSLIEHRFSRKAPRNIYGEAPFREGKDFAEPNEAYFEHAEWVLRRAREKGFLVLLTPAYMGSGGGSEGWYQSMKKAGVQTLNSYGQYLGRRFRDLPNIVWMNGGDYDPPDKALLTALAGGLSKTDPDALQSVHGGPESGVGELWRGAPWLNFDTIYTYENVARKTVGRYIHGPSIPFILIESRYENEGADEQRLRQIAYGALLSGASGQIFGNNPMWHFSGPGLYHAPATWREALSSRGAESMTHVERLFDTLPWWKLEPDQGQLVADGASLDNVVCGRAADGSFALVYLSDTKSVSLDLERLSVTARQARWYDPSSGQYFDASGTTDGSGVTRFEVPAAKNESGYHDWVLLIGEPD